MKILKRIFACMLVASMTAFVSCSDDDEPVVPEVPVVSTTYSYVGKTTVISIGGTYENTEMTYGVTFDESKETATITINNPKFAESMPSNLGVMEFPGVELEVNKDGYILRADELLPEINDVPYPGFMITDLTGSFSFTTGGTLNFRCADRWNVKAVLTVPTAE